MNLKSLVNKSIIKSDLRRFWYIGALFIGALLLAVAIPIIDRVKHPYPTGFDSGNFWSMANTGIFVIMLFAIMTPVILFSYLHKGSRVCATHSLPLKRKCIFFSHITASAILLIVPLIINTIVMLSVKDLYAVDIIKWFGLSLVYCIVFCGFGVLSSAIGGSTFSSSVISMVIMLLPVYTASMFELLADNYLFGYTYFGKRSLASIVEGWYLPYGDLNGYKLLIYLALGITFGAIGFVCYKKRALESNINVTAFNILNHVFVYAAALFGGFLGTLYIAAILDVFSIWIAIPFGIICIIIARMIITKSFRPNAVIKPSLIYIGIMAVIYLFVGLDITGYEKRIPDIDDIAMVDISGMSESRTRPYYYNTELVMIAPEAIYDTELEDKEDIEKVVALHKEITKQARIGQAENSNSRHTIPIVYTLKNGKIMTRQYWYQETEVLKEMYYDVQDIPTVKAYTYPVLSDAEREYISGEINTCGFDFHELSKEQINELTAALKEDISKVSVRDMTSDTLTEVRFTIQRPLVDGNGKRVDTPEYPDISEETYEIRTSYTNTVSLLKEWGMFKVMPTVADIESIRFTYFNDDGSRDREEWIVDKDKIQKYLDYLSETYDIENDKRSPVRLGIYYYGDTNWEIPLREIPNIG